MPSLAEQPGPLPTNTQPWVVSPSNRLVKPGSGWARARPAKSENAARLARRHAEPLNWRPNSGEVVLINVMNAFLTAQPLAFRRPCQLCTRAQKKQGRLQAVPSQSDSRTDSIFLWRFVLFLAFALFLAARTAGTHWTRHLLIFLVLLGGEDFLHLLLFLVHDGLHLFAPLFPRHAAVSED